MGRLNYLKLIAILIDLLFHFLFLIISLKKRLCTSELVSPIITPQPQTSSTMMASSSIVVMALFILARAASSFTYTTSRTARLSTTARYVTKEAVQRFRQQAGFGSSSTSSLRTPSVKDEPKIETTAAQVNHIDIVNGSSTSNKDHGEEEERYMPPWSLPTQRTPNSKAFARFRQHVNPLSRRFQMPTDLPNNWPHSDFTNVNLPLYLDIGCGKGGFLLELVGRRHNPSYVQEFGTDCYMNSTKNFIDTTDDWLPNKMNYLGLEIRPGVSQYAQNRVEKRGLSGILSFVGCNANVDLDRLLSLYNEASSDDAKGGNEDGNSSELKFVSVQFPDPHFKKSHKKRRVVSSALVTTLAKFMNQGGVVFLQSDIKEALEAMREKFVEGDGLVCFNEHTDDVDDKDVVDEQEYALANPLGIPTEREVSVLNNDLPIYRTLFIRNDVSFPSKSSLLARNL